MWLAMCVHTLDVVCEYARMFGLSISVGRILFTYTHMKLLLVRSVGRLCHTYNPVSPPVYMCLWLCLTNRIRAVVGWLAMKLYTATTKTMPNTLEIPNVQTNKRSLLENEAAAKKFPIQLHSFLLILCRIRYLIFFFSNATSFVRHAVIKDVVIFIVFG